MIPAAVDSGVLISSIPTITLKIALSNQEVAVHLHVPNYEPPQPLLTVPRGTVPYRTSCQRRPARRRLETPPKATGKRSQYPAAARSRRDEPALLFPAPTCAGC